MRSIDVAETTGPLADASVALAKRSQMP